MILAGAGRRLQTCGGLTAKLFDSTLRTIFRILMTLSLTISFFCSFSSTVKGGGPCRPQICTSWNCHRRSRRPNLSFESGSLSIEVVKGPGFVCLIICVCMILAGAGRRLQTCGGLTAMLFDSTLRTIFRILMTLSLTISFFARFLPQ